MLANLRRKLGMSTGAPPTPVPGMHNGVPGGPSGPEPMVLSTPTFVEPGAPGVPPGGVPPPFTMEELGLPWPGNAVSNFSPSDIPVWLQEQVGFVFLSFTSPLYTADDLVFCVPQSLTDLGLPLNGLDGIFMNLNRASGWPGEFAPMPEAW